MLDPSFVTGRSPHRTEAPEPPPKPPAPEKKVPGDWFYFRRGIGQVMRKIGEAALWVATFIACAWSFVWASVLLILYLVQPEDIPKVLHWANYCALSLTAFFLMSLVYKEAVKVGRKRRVSS